MSLCSKDVDYRATYDFYEFFNHIFCCGWESEISSRDGFQGNNVRHLQAAVVYEDGATASELLCALCLGLFGVAVPVTLLYVYETRPTASKVVRKAISCIREVSFFLYMLASVKSIRLASVLEHVDVWVIGTCAVIGVLCALIVGSTCLWVKFQREGAAVSERCSWRAVMGAMISPELAKRDFLIAGSAADLQMLLNTGRLCEVETLGCKIKAAGAWMVGLICLLRLDTAIFKALSITLFLCVIHGVSSLIHLYLPESTSTPRRTRKDAFHVARVNAFPPDAETGFNKHEIPSTKSDELRRIVLVLSLMGVTVLLLIDVLSLVWQKQSGASAASRCSLVSAGAFYVAHDPGLERSTLLPILSLKQDSDQGSQKDWMFLSIDGDARAHHCQFGYTIRLSEVPSPFSSVAEVRESVSIECGRSADAEEIVGSIVLPWGASQQLEDAVHRLARHASCTWQ